MFLGDLIQILGVLLFFLGDMAGSGSGIRFWYSVLVFGTGIRFWYVVRVCGSSIRFCEQVSVFTS